MWNGKVTKELLDLVEEYSQQFDGADADGYDDFNYDSMSYEYFVELIKRALREGVEIPELFPEFR